LPPVWDDAMTAFRSIWRTLTALLLAAAYWLAVQGTALAAAAKTTEPEEQSSGGASWIASYVLLVLFVALGVFVVLKPSGRRYRAKPEQYGE
jgi:hypothetical protein